MLVHYEFFIGIESNVHPAPPLSLVAQDIDSKFQLNVFYEPFYNLSQKSELYKGYGFDQITILTNFVILHSELMKLKKPVEKNAISDVKGAYVCDAKDSYISKELLILNEASQKFWGNADPKEKDTHSKRDVVIKYLTDNNFSEIKAKIGASIIRPEWAVSGRRSTD
jgi:hypothetical protein